MSLEHCFLGYWSTGGYEEGHWRIEYWRTEGSNKTLEAGRLDGSKTYNGNCSGAFPQPGGPGGRRIYIYIYIYINISIYIYIYVHMYV